MTPTARPYPDLDDPVASPFWKEAATGRLAFQRCRGCGYLRWPPATLCPECWTPHADWTPVSPEGSVWGFAVYERAFSPGFERDVPYVVALVELDAGPRLVSRLVGVDPGAAAVGTRVTARFEPFAAGAALVQFGPVER